MGIMTKRTVADRRKVVRFGALGILALFLWSFAASPSPIEALASEEEIEEPLSAYNALADAAPIRGLVQHNTYLVSAEPALARSTSEVSLPSQGTSTSWLIDLGTPNGLHGTTTGNKVPTEATATQPGGDEVQEFKLGRTNLGNDALVSFGAGVSRATATHSERPRGYGYGYLGNVALLPAPGSPEAPPGTYDPEADEQKEKEIPPSPTASPTPTRPPDDPTAYTPNPRAQMAIISIGSMASTAETFREQTTVTSISVAEINGISIGNRTADGRCTNCITIDSLRVETRAESDGVASKASWRILLHRACRVATTNDPVTGAAYEGVTCLGPNPDKVIEAAEDQDSAAGQDAVRDPNARGIREIRTLDKLDAAFKSLTDALKPLGVKDIGITLRVGTDKENNAVTNGAEAAAAARGIVIELKTSVLDALVEVAGTNEGVKSLIQTADTGCSTVIDPVAGQLSKAPPLPVPVPRDCGTAAKQIAGESRTLRIALGQVRSAAQASPGGLTGEDPDLGPVTPEFPTITIPEFNIPDINIPAQSGGGNTFITGGGGPLQAGPVKIKFDWSAAGVQPWEAKDLAKGLFTGSLAAAAFALIRRRLGMI